MAAVEQKVPLADKLIWTVAEFAKLIAWEVEYVYRRTGWNEAGTDGTIYLPGGVNVPVHRVSKRQAVIYKDQYRKAVAAAPTVEVVHLPGRS